MVDSKTLENMRQRQHIMNDETINAHVNDYGVLMQSDIPYMDDGSEYHLLDVYSPADYKKDKKLPVVIVIHGGGYSSGYKELDRRIAQFVATNGFHAVNINYTLMPEVGFETELKEVFTVADWISTHSEEYGFDDTRVSVMGDSSAGHYVMMVAAAQNNPDTYGYFNISPYKNGFRGYVSICPATFEIIKTSDNEINAEVRSVLSDWFEDEEYYKHCLYTEYMNKNYPRIMIVTTPTDSILASESIALHKYMVKNNIDHVYKSYEGVKNKLDHVFNVLFPEYEESKQANADIIAYLKECSK